MVLGAGTGSFLGPIGTVIGAGIGAGALIYLARKDKEKKSPAQKLCHIT